MRPNRPASKRLFQVAARHRPAAGWTLQRLRAQMKAGGTGPGGERGGHPPSPGAGRAPARSAGKGRAAARAGVRRRPPERAVAFSSGAAHQRACHGQGSRPSRRAPPRRPARIACLVAAGPRRLNSPPPPFARRGSPPPVTTPARVPATRDLPCRGRRAWGRRACAAAPAAGRRPNGASRAATRTAPRERRLGHLAQRLAPAPITLRSVRGGGPRRRRTRTHTGNNFPRSATKASSVSFIAHEGELRILHRARRRVPYLSSRTQ